jgi:integrase
MKAAKSGSRGVFWRANERGTQELRTATGRQRGDWWIRWKCPHGHLHRGQVGPKSLAREQSERHRIQRPCPLRKPKPASYLLADVIREYLDATKNQKRSHKDDARYGRGWSERFAGRTLEEVTPAELDKIRAERLKIPAPPDDENERPKKPTSPATVNREFAFLKHVFTIAVRDGKTDTNPVAKLKMLREPSGRTRYLSDEEETALLEALPSDEDRQRVTMLLHTGFRRGELLGLRWRDIDFKAGVLTIPKSKNGDARHVPMTSTVRAILSRRARPLDAATLVFPNTEGTRDLRWAKKTVPAALRAARIEDFRFHDLRHTFASRLAMESVDLMTIRDLMGHKTMTMTLRYSHLSPGHRQNAVERLVTRPVVKAEPAAGAGAE